MSRGVTAGGTITPATILIWDTTNAAGRVIMASSATAAPFAGVAQPGTRQAPLAGLDDGNVALGPANGNPGENLTMYTEGDRCLVYAGGAITVGQLLTSNSSGQAIATTTHGNFVIGQALQNATGAGYLIEMLVMPQMYAE